jgi:phosphoglycerate dehydrogenase-like enzyme
MTAAILGFGGIGRATACLMRAFGMRISAITTTGTSPESADFVGTLHDLERVLRESDMVVISLHVTKATRGFIGKEELAWPGGAPAIARAEQLVETRLRTCRRRDSSGAPWGTRPW